MANILNLKDPDTSESPDAEDEVVKPVEDLEAESTQENEAYENILDMPDDAEDERLYPEEVAWKVVVRPDSLERRKEHIMMAFLAGTAIAVAYWIGSMPLVFIAGLTIVAWEVHHRAHDEADVHINAEGVRVNEYRHPFAKLESFSIMKMPNDTWHLSIRHSSSFVPDVRIPMGEHDHEEVRAVLANHIDEDDHPVPISELFLKS